MKPRHNIYEYTNAKWNKGKIIIRQNHYKAHVSRTQIILYQLTYESMQHF